MAAATITKTSYGFLATGGVDATDIITTQAYVKRFVYIPATNGNTVVVKNTRSASSIFKTAGATANTAYVYDVGGEKGTSYEGLNVTLGGANDELHVHVA